MTGGINLAKDRSSQKSTVCKGCHRLLEGPAANFGQAHYMYCIDCWTKMTMEQRRKVVINHYLR